MTCGLRLPAIAAGSWPEISARYVTAKMYNLNMVRLSESLPLFNRSVRIKHMEQKPLVGPRAHEREKTPLPVEVSLDGGQPLYYALLPNPEALVLSPAEVQGAKSRLAEIVAIDAQKVMSCQGKSLEDARSILESVESRG